jgi:DNA-binding NarL/FixJ family response regulator
VEGTKALSVAIVEDLREIREGLALLIGGTPGLRCAGTFSSMEEALARLGPGAPDLPDVVLVDLGLPGMDGIEGIRVLRERHPALVMLVLTVYEDDRRILEALCAGANGYLLKKTPPARLLDALHEAAAGGAPMSPEIARRVVDLFRRFRPAPPSDCDLTPHELRLLRLLVEGHQYKTAASELGVTTATVSFHVQQIYRKLHVHSKSEAVARALREGLLG